MKHVGREKRGIMLGELLEHMEDAQEVVSSATELVSMACELEAYGEPESSSYDGEGGEQMQEGPQGVDEVLQQGIEGYEQMVNTFAEQAKLFWRSWGPVSEPLVQGIEAWAELQRTYINWLRQNTGAGGRP